MVAFHLIFLSSPTVLDWFFWGERRASA